MRSSRSYLEQDGLRMHYVDEGSGDPVLMLHGEPTWAFLYRKMIPTIARCRARRRPRLLRLRPLGQADADRGLLLRLPLRVDRAVRRRSSTCARRRVVVQDWGGPIGLRLAVERPDRVARLVILNTGIGAGRAPSDEWLRFREFVRRVGTDLVPGQLIRISAVTELADEVVDAYNAPFPTPESKAGVLAFPELVPTELDHPSAAKMMEVRAALESWDKPTLVLFSDSDPIFTPVAAEHMASRIPGAGPAETIVGAGHFLQEEKGEEIAERIVRFLAGELARDRSRCRRSGAAPSSSPSPLCSRAASSCSLMRSS